MLNAIYPIIGKQTALPFYLTGIGVSEPEYHVERKKGLISHQFLFTSSGSGILNVGGNSYIQKKRSMFYLSPGVAHEYYPQADSWTTNWFVFRGNYASELLHELGFGSCNVALELTETKYEQLERAFHRILAAASDLLGGAEKASALIYEFTMAARDAILLQTTENSASGSIVEDAVQYIKQNYRSDIALEDLSKISGISLQHFCRVFRMKMGMRPMEYTARTRISEAKLLLVNTNESICDIAKKVGYEDQNYFGIVFKKYEGIAPSEYRRLKGSIIL